MSTVTSQPRVVPAQLDFLAIYNPSLGTSDETLKEQILYYHADKTHSHHIAQKDNAPGQSGTHNAELEENDRLQQVGLAQGMVQFAKTFSPDPVDCVETEKTRVILRELESGWWILATIRLTRLPAAQAAQDAQARVTEEYSAREVAPASLLSAQLERANAVFLLHHAASLQELWDRVGRTSFCTLLERFWDQFVRKWDVLLHGSPAVAIYNATKLSGGGELGFGVGEEEWGSGEREVLEGFMDRTEGLMDLVVGRYGPSPPESTQSRSIASPSAQQSPLWLGQGEDPAASDGLIFTGKGLLSRRSLATVSAWMEAVFRDGGRAYGVAQNPASRARQGRKRLKTDRKSSRPESISPSQSDRRPNLRSPKGQTQPLRRQAIENSTSSPGIPAPLVGQVERSLHKALSKADKRASSRNSRSENTQEDGALKDHDHGDEKSASTTDNMMKYLTLGYGTAWSLGSMGLKHDNTSGTDEQPPPSTTTDIAGNSADHSTMVTEANALLPVDPTPEVSDEESAPFVQHLEQSIGKFLIGLSGDLEQTELEVDNEDDHAPNSHHEHRLFLRTLTIETAQPHHQRRSQTHRLSSYQSTTSATSVISKNSTAPTSAGDSIDGAEPNATFAKVQVAVYVHQPFMFIFLFELHTPSLTMPSFYRSIHNQLGPLQKPLLRSTDPARTMDRLVAVLQENSNTVQEHLSGTNPIYDLIYDPKKQTIRTSIPNIPTPGSMAAEGLISRSPTMSGAWYTLGIPIQTSSTRNTTQSTFRTAWSRIEALSVHTQILNSWLATRSGRELEHTAKTGRGWWILWMSVNSKTEEGTPREAILVRKVTEMSSPSKRSTSNGPGRWLLREQPREASSSGGAGRISTAKGVSDGVGVDARRWIDGLLQLTQ